VFFFQAEDGIRDLIVTGVQTCALPISVASLRATSMGIQNATARRLAELDLTTTMMTMAATLIAFSRDEVTSFDRHIGGLVSKNRSEERRVGTECRYRCATADEEKKARS